ncbi:sodium/potassium-transporting ATPase subunit beta-like [Argonauta hians]
MYHSEELHLANKAEYEFGGEDDLNFLPRNENKVFQLGSLRIRKTIFKIGVVAGLLLLSILFIYLVVRVKHIQNEIHNSPTDNTYSALNILLPTNKHVIKFNTFDKYSYLPFTNNIKAILKVHWQGTTNNSQLEDCSVQGLHTTKHNCIFEPHQLGNCIHLPYNGYQEGRPCILFTLRMPGNISPRPLEKTDPLVKKYLTGVWSEDHIPVTCTGETESDQKSMIRPDPLLNESISYSPKQGFSLDYFPLVRGPHYQSPLLMVQFHTLRTGVTINVRCKAWATYNGTQIKSNVKFQLQMN